MIYLQYSMFSGNSAGAASQNQYVKGKDTYFHVQVLLLVIEIQKHNQSKHRH
jgi:hypothetical protein